jgi:cytochrome c-type biogenesis protein
VSPDSFFSSFYELANGWLNFSAQRVDQLPVSYAFGAGMLATINPCGFIMLPSFAAFYVTSHAEQDAPQVQRLYRALLMGLLVTAAFVVTFGVTGVVLTSGGRFIVEWVGWAGLGIGAALVALALAQLATGRSLMAGTTSNVRVQRSATTRGVLAFGVAYAVASLGCTLPVFLIVAGNVFTGTGSFSDSVGRFIQYAAGMGLVLTVITVGVAGIRDQTVRFVSRALPVVEAVGNVLLIFAGSYLIWYWTTKGDLL